MPLGQYLVDNLSNCGFLPINAFSQVRNDRRTTETQTDGNVIACRMEGIRIDLAGQRLGGLAKFGVNPAQAPFIQKDTGAIFLMRQAVALAGR